MLSEGVVCGGFEASSLLTNTACKGFFGVPALLSCYSCPGSSPTSCPLCDSSVLVPRACDCCQTLLSSVFPLGPQPNPVALVLLLAAWGQLPGREDRRLLDLLDMVALRQWLSLGRAMGWNQQVVSGALKGHVKNQELMVTGEEPARRRI